MKILVLLLLLTSPIKLWAQSADSLTLLEKELRQRLQQPGVHVVHLWAPWCHNSRDELSKGWAWTPSTWIFHKNGRLAYALNYGEIDMELLQQLIDYAVRPW